MFWVDFLPILCRVLTKTLVQLDFLAKISKNVQSTERNAPEIWKFSVHSKFLVYPRAANGCTSSKSSLCKSGRFLCLHFECLTNIEACSRIKGTRDNLVRGIKYSAYSD